MKVFAAFLMTCALLPAFADTVPTEHVVVLPNVATGNPSVTAATAPCKSEQNPSQ